MSTLIDLIDKAVQKAVFTDPPPVGINVSGGLDSSTVARFALKWMPDLPCFTGWYDVPGFDERKWARMAIGKTANHHEIQITPVDFVENFDAMMEHFTPPFQGPGMFGQYMVAEYIANLYGTGIQGVMTPRQGNAVLSGEGSDELFGGYARTLAVAGLPLPDGYVGYEIPDGYPSTVQAALDYDHERLPALLKVDDEALGAFGLVGVAPFTDQRIVDYALALNPIERLGKVHLRNAVRGIVPDPIIDRTDKKGFPVPLVQWANEKGNPVSDFVGDKLGYIPDPGKPFDRAWWAELLDAGKPEPARLAA